jgi:hypothetical protein
VGRDSSVCITTGYGLEGPGIESQLGEIFCTRPYGTGTHPASCIMGTGCLSLGKSRRGVALTTYPHLVVRVELYIHVLPLCAFKACSMVNFITRSALQYILAFRYTFNPSHSPNLRHIVARHYSHNVFEYMCLILFYPLRSGFLIGPFRSVFLLRRLISLIRAIYSTHLILPKLTT